MHQAHITRYYHRVMVVDGSTRFSRLAGDQVLDLMNTVDWRLDPTRSLERLPDLDAVLDWCLFVEVISTEEHLGLLAQSAAHPRRSTARHAAFLDWRELAYAAIVDGSQNAMQRVVRGYRDVLARTELGAEASGGWSWHEPRLTLDTPLDRVVRATLDLATNPSMPMLHQCEDNACGWVYLDTSPRHNRRWCSAAGCGNRNRARRFHERRRQGEPHT
jgi:predicted RNA-binding Zn ribbon-like protein